MKVVLDANELFSVIITKGRNWRSKALDIFFSDKAELSAPFRLLAELERNREEIRSKSGFSYEDFDVFIGLIKLRIDFLPLEDFLDKLDEAKKLSPHSKDIEFFALAFKLDAAVWSEEKSFKKQDKIRVFNTLELYKRLKL